MLIEKIINKCEDFLLNQSISKKFLIESKFIDAKSIDHGHDDVEEIVNLILK